MFTTDNALFTKDGIRYSMTVKPDEDMGYPWVEHDGHGVCVQNGWLRTSDRYVHLIHDWYYDRMSSLERAKEQGWGPGTPEQAVEHDLKHLLGYCAGDWWYVGVIVTARWKDIVLAKESLWGIESSDADYLTSTANDLYVQCHEDTLRLIAEMATTTGACRPPWKLLGEKLIAKLGKGACEYAYSTTDAEQIGRQAYDRGHITRDGVIL